MQLRAWHIAVAGFALWALRRAPEVRLEATTPPPADPPGYRRMRDSEVTTELSQIARSLLSRPLGTHVPFQTSNGRSFIAALEIHPPSVSIPRPHKGVSLFAQAS